MNSGIGIKDLQVSTPVPSPSAGPKRGALDPNQIAPGAGDAAADTTTGDPAVDFKTAVMTALLARAST